MNIAKILIRILLCYPVLIVFGALAFLTLPIRAILESIPITMDAVEEIIVWTYRK